MTSTTGPFLFKPLKEEVSSYGWDGTNGGVGLGSGLHELTLGIGEQVVSHWRNQFLAPL